MDESSSVFVDRLALEKILCEKLDRVRHRPPAYSDDLRVPILGAVSAEIEPPETLSCVSPDVFLLKSPFENECEENGILPLHYYPSEEEKGDVLLIHGLFEDNRAMYGFFIGELNRLGYSVYMTTLPYHHERKPMNALFSGELFFSADLLCTKNAFKQAVLEARCARAWIRKNAGRSPYVAGFSMGATVALGAACVSDCSAGVCLINPAAGLSEVIWTSPLCATIKRDLLNGGWNRHMVESAVSSFDPFNMPRTLTRDADIRMLYALYDQITKPEQYERLIAEKKLTDVIRLKAGHLNTLRVPRLAADLVCHLERNKVDDVKTANRRTS